MERGAKVTVVGFRGIKLQRRVWEDVGLGVLVCSEEEYKRALRLGEEPQAAGFPKQDVLVIDRSRTQAVRTDQAQLRA